MRLLRYLPLLGLQNSTEIAQSTGQSNDVVTASSLFAPATTAIHTHHGHANIHRAHSMMHHPTHQARLAHLKAKENAYERINQQQILQRDLAVPKFRPLVVTNHLDHTIFPGYSSKQQSGGFELPSKSTFTIQLPLGELDMFRIWVRQGCEYGKTPDELHCLTGDCHGKLVCDGWNKYGNSLGEIAIFPQDNSMWPDLSYVESGSRLPLKFSVDGCLSLSCDASQVPCPESMKVEDASGNLLECACGAKDWNMLLDPILGCPNEGGAAIQKAWKKACPDVYSFAEDDLTGQKHCPYSDATLRFDIGIPEEEDKVHPKPQDQIIVGKGKNEIPSDQNPPELKHKETSKESGTPTITFENWWTDTPEWKKWAANGFH